MIRADFVRMDDLALMNQWMPALMCGDMSVPPRAQPGLLRRSIPSPAARASKYAPRLCEFPCVDPRLVGRRYRHVFLPGRIVADAVLRLDSLVRIVESGQGMLHLRPYAA